MNEGFDERWAMLRNRVSTGDTNVSMADEVQGLIGVAASESERLKAACLLVQVGASLQAERLRWQGHQEIRSGDWALSSLLFELCPDLTMFGSATERWAVLEAMITSEVGVDDLGVAFVTRPSAEAALRLIDEQWSPPEQLPVCVQSELKLQIGWRAVERFLQEGCTDSRELLKSNTLRLRPRVEPGWWEQSIQRSAVALAEGNETSAMALICGLDSASLPRWAQPPIEYNIARFAVLASCDARSWIALAGDRLLGLGQARSNIDRALFSLTAMLVGKTKATPQVLVRLGDELESYPWLAFAGFCNQALARSAREHLARQLLGLSRAELECMHWKGHEESFALSAESLDDRAEALRLVTMALRYSDHPRIRQAVRPILDAMSGKQLFEARQQQPDLWPVVTDAAALASPQRRAQIGRGGTYRAVIDGSNVMWGGLDRRHGGVPRLRRLQEAIDDLRRAGFEEINVYVDSSTRHRLPDNELSSLGRMQNSKQVSVVDGKADPQVIRCFFEHPEASEIVSCDIYRDEMLGTPLEVPLRSLPRSKWRKFHLGREGRLAWNDPLDEEPRNV